MRPYDAIFMAIGLGTLATLPRLWWLTVFVPVASHLLKSTPFDRFEAPLTAIVACALAAHCAPVAFILAIPDYRSVFDAGGHALFWLAMTCLCGTLSERHENNSVKLSTRGLPAQLFYLAVLYYTLLPVSYL